MRQFLTVMQRRKFLSSLLSILFVVWLVGPYLAIAGNTPLATLSSRLLASLAAFLFFFILEYQREVKTSLGHTTLPDDIKQELLTVQKTLQSVIRALHSNVIKSFFLKYKKPWYLVLGPQQAGKSTLLNKAELNIRGLDNLPPMTITPTKNFSWWLADDAVFIDIGGCYLRDKELVHRNGPLFQGFFKLLKKYRTYKPINGLILTVNLQELTVNTKEQSQLKNLQFILNELFLQFINFPIYIVVTRCDTIEGFGEYFEDLSPEERNQLFGISFPLSIQSYSLPQLFNDQYDALLTRLNERVIWRLSKEHNLDKIGKIKNFPLQMEFLKHPLAKLLNVILPNSHLNLRGIFFTSALQKDTPFDNLTNTLSSAYDIHHLHQGHRLAPPKSFFISEIFRRTIFPENKYYSANNPDHRLQFMISLLVLMISLGCGFLFLKSYRYNFEAIKNTQQIINVINQQPTETKADLFLQNLDKLHDIIQQLNGDQGPWYKHLGMQQAHKLQKKAEYIYNHLLTTQFIGYLQRTLEIQLQNTQEENTNQLYATLKTYLMLGDRKHFDQKFFTTWFNNYWHQLSDDTINHQNINNHLSALLRLPLKDQALNNQLIESKRMVLNRIPQSRLVLAILANQYQRSPVKLATGFSLKTFNNIPDEISGIYNIVNFKNVYYKEITNTCQEITHGDWVLGKKPQPAFSDIMLNQLSNEVKAIYLNEYAVTWSSILNKIKLDDYQTLDQIVNIVELLNNPQSPLIQLINTIRDNTQPISDSVEFTQQVSSRFLILNTLSSDLLKNINQASLMAVKQYLNNIIRAPEIERACYDAAKGRMEKQTANDPVTTLLQQARLLPEPLQTWHTTLAAESWRIILHNTQSYLNKIWVGTVYPQYLAVLDKRYPLFKESPVDASLTDFANFFGYGGTMDTFFKNYLQPFVDSSRLYWEWKSVDGQKINISQTTLEMFIRAALIQKMFFPEEARIPAITFSLVPVDLDPGLQSFNLNLEGQPLVFQKDNEQIITLAWPGPQPGRSEIDFIDNQGKKVAVAERGPWSWFKIIDKSHLEGTASPKHFRLTFSANGAAVHYELYTNGIVNPFIPGILSAFRCAENLQ